MNMATEYRALPGGDGGEWATEPAPRHLVPVAPSTAGQGIRKRPLKTRRIDLEGEYAGWWFVVRTNAPIQSILVLDGLETTDRAEMVRAMGKLIDALPRFMVDWNFVDEEGADLECGPPGFATLDAELLMEILKGIVAGLSAESAVPKD